MPRATRHLSDLAEVFRIMGDQTRLSILIALQEDEKNVTSLVKKLKVPQSTVSHHLALLRMAELVRTRRSGKEIYYSLNGGQIRSIRGVRSILKDSAGLKLGGFAFGMTK